MKQSIDPAATLHTLNVSPREYRALFERLIRLASPGDNLLLIENGVYALTDDKALQDLRALGLGLYCLEADVEARGLAHWPALAEQIAGMPPEHLIRIVNDSGFVALSCEHRKVVSWFP